MLERMSTPFSPVTATTKAYKAQGQEERTSIYCPFLLCLMLMSTQFSLAYTSAYAYAYAYAIVTDDN